MNKLMEGGTDLRNEQRKENKENFYIRFKYFASLSNLEKYCMKEQKNAEECAEKRRENKRQGENVLAALYSAVGKASSPPSSLLSFSSSIKSSSASSLLPKR